MKIYLLGCAFAYKSKAGLSYSASGIEFEAENSFEAELTSDKCGSLADGEIHHPRYALYCDGELVKDSRILGEKEQLFWEKAGRHVYRLLKLSESADSTMFAEIKSVDGSPVDGEGFENGNQVGGIEYVEFEKRSGRLLIEYIGDSITCGYGVEGKLSPEDHYTTATENCTKAYAYLSAGLLNADCRLVSKSGSGIISGYTGDGIRNTMNLLAPVYDSVGCSWAAFQDGTNPVEIPRKDIAEPDITVINLGTNDVSYCYPAMGFGRENMSEEEKELVNSRFFKNEGIVADKSEEKDFDTSGPVDYNAPEIQDFVRQLRCDLFYREYRAFLGKIRAKYPNTTIIACKGIMNTELNDVVEKALNDGRKEDLEIGRAHV